MCDEYEKKVTGFFKRTRFPIKPYGTLFHTLSRNSSSLPSISYGEAVNMNVDFLKKHFWCKIFSKGDKRNIHKNKSLVIRNPCWNYTKFVSVNTLFFDKNLELVLDKSMRHNSNSKKPVN